jgi:hypothetical protein
VNAATATHPSSPDSHTAGWHAPGCVSATICPGAMMSSPGTGKNLLATDTRTVRVTLRLAGSARSSSSDSALHGP